MRRFWRNIVGAVIGAIVGLAVSGGNPFAAVAGAIIGWGFTTGYLNQSSGTGTACGLTNVSVSDNNHNKLVVNWLYNPDCNGYRIFIRRETFMAFFTTPFELVGTYEKPIITTTLNNLNPFQTYRIKVVYIEGLPPVQYNRCWGQIDVLTD